MADDRLLVQSVVGNGRNLVNLNKNQRLNYFEFRIQTAQYSAFNNSFRPECHYQSLNKFSRLSGSSTTAKIRTKQVGFRLEPAKLGFESKIRESLGMSKKEWIND